MSKNKKRNDLAPISQLFFIQGLCIPFFLSNPKTLAVHLLTDSQARFLKFPKNQISNLMISLQTYTTNFIKGFLKR